MSMSSIDYQHVLGDARLELGPDLDLPLLFLTSADVHSFAKDESIMKLIEGMKIVDQM
jgi:hypothetical protein